MNECMTRRQPWRGVSSNGGFFQVQYHNYTTLYDMLCYIIPASLACLGYA